MAEKICPNCHGMKVVLDPAEEKMEGPCPMCQGEQKVDVRKVCACGRPGVKEWTGLWYCGRSECWKKLAERDGIVVAAKVIKPKHPPLGTYSRWENGKYVTGPIYGGMMHGTEWD